MAAGWQNTIVACHGIMSYPATGDNHYRSVKMNVCISLRAHVGSLQQLCHLGVYLGCKLCDGHHATLL